MPPDRRRRRFRRPGTGRWLTETPPTLRIELAPQVRNTLTAWMRLYGEANDVRGLATGPIETRFARLRENTAADSLIVWTTPGRWAGGEGLSLRFPDLHLEFTCTLADGHLIATKVGQVPEDARPPDREAGAVGVIVHPERIPLPPEDVDSSEPDAGVEMLERHFAQLAGRRWGGFAEPLKAALDAEARDDEARTQRLTVAFTEAALTRGGEEDVWRLKGLNADALRGLDDGEWLEILDDQGRSRASARVIDAHPGSGTLVIGVRTSADPPRTGFVRPRSRKKILEQKRALLEELASPTGSLPNLVRLVAAPASMPTPRQVRPTHFVNAAVLRNRSQARAVALALGLEDGQALLIQGPPGTGKSTTAAEIDVQLILRDPGVKVLVCSHSNHGTDNMLMKVLPFIEDAPERIARVGFYERIAKEARPFYAAADTDLGEKNIIFTTIDALVLQDIAGARVYDYVILDEANRAGVLDSLLALARGKRMVLVGDPMQLQPVMSEAEQQIVAASAPNNGGGGRRGRGRGNRRPALTGVAQPGANHVIGKSLFAWIQERRFAPGSTVLLDQQNRMHPAIGELVSRVFYSNRVRTGPAAPRRGTGLAAFPSPVTWVDTRSLRGNVESRAGGTSLFNVAEARLVTSITRHLATFAPPNLTIGVITAYAEQRDLLRRLMGPHDWPPDRQMEIDTVDAFEGREKDIIVLSLVRANRRRDIGFLRLEQRLNVAVSRSRRLIILVGDTSTLRGGYFHNLVNQTQTLGQVIPAPKLIGQFLSRGAPGGAGAAGVAAAAGSAGTGTGGGRRPWQDRDQRRRERDTREGHVVRVGADGEDQDRDGLAAAALAAAPGGSADAAVTPAGESGHAGQAGQEGQEGGFGSRRRRRRAWERRRDRLRALREGGPEEGLSDGDVDGDGEGELAVQPADVEVGATDVALSAGGVRPAMAPGAAERLAGRAGEDAGGVAERAAHSGQQDQGQRMGQRPRRRRRFGIPRSEDASGATPGRVDAFESAAEGAVGTAGIGPRAADEQIFMPVRSGEDELSAAFAPAADLTSPSSAAGRRRRRPSRIADTIAALEAQVSVSTAASSSAGLASPSTLVSRRGAPGGPSTSASGVAAAASRGEPSATGAAAPGSAAPGSAAPDGGDAGSPGGVRGRGRGRGSRGGRQTLAAPTVVSESGRGSAEVSAASFAQLSAGSAAQGGGASAAERRADTPTVRSAGAPAEVSVGSPAGAESEAQPARRGRPRRATPASAEAASAPTVTPAPAAGMQLGIEVPAAPVLPGAPERATALRRGRSTRAAPADTHGAGREAAQPAPMSPAAMSPAPISPVPMSRAAISPAPISRPVVAPARRGRRPAAAAVEQSAAPDPAAEAPLVTAPAVASEPPGAQLPASAAPNRVRRTRSAATGKASMVAAAAAAAAAAEGEDDGDNEPRLARTSRTRRAATVSRQTAPPARAAESASTSASRAAEVAEAAEVAAAPKRRARQAGTAADAVGVSTSARPLTGSVVTPPAPARGRRTRILTETEAAVTPGVTGAVTPATPSRRPSRGAASTRSEPTPQQASPSASRRPSRTPSRAGVSAEAEPKAAKASRGASRSPSRAAGPEPSARRTARGRAAEAAQAVAAQAVARAGTNGTAPTEAAPLSPSASAIRRGRAVAAENTGGEPAAQRRPAANQNSRARASTRATSEPAESAPPARPARARKS